MPEHRSQASIAAEVDASYIRTRQLLVGTPGYDSLKLAADDEATSRPDVWIARNRLAFYIECNTPMSWES